MEVTIPVWTGMVLFSGIVFDESYLTHYCEIRGILGERSEIGAGTLVGSGVILMRDVEPFTMVLAKQEQEIISWGKEIYDK
ncbi:MAG: hypothetical protein ACTSVB_11365 [Candidatus Heimdallarchaeaceae archaeon]